MLLFAHISEGNEKEKASNERDRVREIRAGNKKAYEELFFEYHNQLIRFANTITKSREFARDAVQDVFLKIWRNRENWEINYSLKVYLYQSVRNQSLNLLEKQNSRLRVKSGMQKELQEREEKVFVDDAKHSHLSDYELRLLKKIWELVGEMPERKRIVFELHRKHGLSYKEIAKILGITRKTVENHIAQAFQFLRSNINTEDYK
ncbi:MAG: RNA polymerase sigma-70 factor [Balneolaceae bacterium]